MIKYLIYKKEMRCDRMKKILFIIPTLEIGGLERLQVTIANRLTASGNDVTILLLNDCDTIKDELDPRVKLIHKDYKKHIGKKIPYIRNRFYDSGFWETRASAKQLYRHYVGKEKYDVEIAFFRGLPLKIISGSTNREAKHLAWVHSDFSKAKGYLNQFRNLNEARKAYEMMDAVVCVSNQAKDGFIHTFGDTRNIRVIYNMLPVERIVQQAKQPLSVSYARAKLHIVMVGRFLDKVKGQVRLMRAVSRLRKEGTDISLLLIGSGEEEEQLRKIITELHAQAFITIISGIHNPYPYIKRADMLVCSSYFEGYGLTIAEALILETPVISTDCAGPSEILSHGEYGMIVENSESGLYKGLKKASSDPELLSQYRKKAKQRIGFFDADIIGDQIEELFER